MDEVSANDERRWWSVHIFIDMIFDDTMLRWRIKWNRKKDEIESKKSGLPEKEFEFGFGFEFVN